MFMSLVHQAVPSCPAVIGHDPRLTRRGPADRENTLIFVHTWSDRRDVGSEVVANEVCWASCRQLRTEREGTLGKGRC